MYSYKRDHLNIDRSQRNNDIQNSAFKKQESKISR